MSLHPSHGALGLSRFMLVLTLDLECFRSKAKSVFGSGSN